MRSRHAAALLLLLASACGSSSGAPDAATQSDATLAPKACNLLTQDCAESAKPKCALVLPDGVTVFTTCVEQTGSGAERASCTRMSEEATGTGHDDCDKGLFCSGITKMRTTPQPRQCRKYCGADDACNGGDKCVLLVDSDPAVGLCLPTCVLFTDAASCESGLTCRLNADVNLSDPLGVCQPLGNVEYYQQCTSSDDCLKDAQCRKKGALNVCTPVCDSSHHCPVAGHVCTPFSSGAPNGLGLCN